MTVLNFTAEVTCGARLDGSHFPPPGYVIIKVNDWVITNYLIDAYTAERFRSHPNELDAFVASRLATLFARLPILENSDEREI